MATVPGRAVPLRGRSDQLSRGLSVLRRTVRHRRSGIVLVTGEPGIGKSALLDALACEARRLGFVVGRSADRLGGPPSVPVRRMLDGVGGSPSLAVRVLEGLVRAAASPPNACPTSSSRVYANRSPGSVRRPPTWCGWPRCWGGRSPWTR
ncbi:ATP-binding protein [Streptomyces sp. Ag109_O5-1]|uniref:ATP-binding protein n=1 Tax=Streptomyces sp. Ag109_O5-1 TaxID=1938851 RepID=UPI00162561A2|nr:ATP-binding protein [Streptomyces sp. Ag109_O5-1]